MSERRTTTSGFRLAGLGICLITWLISGCLATTGTHPPSSAPVGGDLDHWVDEELTPYLVTQLAQHPRFRGEPVLVVSMSGDDVEADIDGLTSGIRGRIQNALLETPGAHLYWRPTARAWHHHRSLEDLRCDEQRSVRYLIGIDIKSAPGSELAVAVRALDYQDRGWVSGFAKQWHGRASASQTRSMGERRTDEYLRGLRVLPFGVEQADLMAAYLAHNLSCLVRELGESRVVIRSEPLPQRDLFFERVYELVGNYLSRFREVRLAADPGDADFVLRGEVHLIHGGLNQMWVTIESPSGNHALAGAETEAYANVLATPRNPSTPSTPTPMAPARTASVPAIPEPFERILSEPRLMRPASPGECEGSLSWASRSWASTGELVLPPRACYAIEIDVEKPSHVFVLSHDDRGELNRLLPSSCRAVRQGENSYYGGQTLRYPRPSRGSGPSFLISHRPGLETYYVVAASGDIAIREVARHFSAIGDACGSRRTAIVHRHQVQSWLAGLDALARRHGGAVQWRALEVQHAY